VDGFFVFVFAIFFIFFFFFFFFGFFWALCFWIKMLRKNLQRSRAEIYCLGWWCVQFFWPRVVIRKWLNISTDDSEFSADEDDYNENSGSGSDSEAEGLINLALFFYNLQLFFFFFLLVYVDVICSIG
jgi:hypothetical protein